MSSPVNFNVNGQSYQNYTQYYTAINQKGSSTMFLAPMPLPAEREGNVSVREAEIAQRETVLPAPRNSVSADIGVAILGGVLIIGGALVSGASFGGATPLGILMVASGLGIMGAGCGPAEDALSDPTQTSGDVTFSLTGYNDPDFCGPNQVCNFDFKGGQTALREFRAEIKQAGPLDGVKKLVGTISIDSEQAAQIISSNLNGCDPANGRIDECDQNSCRGINSGVLVADDFSGNSSAVPVDDTNMTADIYTDENAYDGARRMMVTSSGIRYLSADPFTVDATVKNNLVNAAFSFAGTQFLTNGLTSALLVDESSDMCNFTLTDIENTTIGTVGGAFSINWNILTPNDAVTGAKNYGRTLATEITGELPITAQNVYICNIFGSGQTEQRLCATVPINKILADKYSGETQVIFDIPDNIWKPYGTMRGFIWSPLSTDLGTASPELKYGSFIEVKIEAQ